MNCCPVHCLPYLLHDVRSNEMPQLAMVAPDWLSRQGGEISLPDAGYCHRQTIHEPRWGLSARTLHSGISPRCSPGGRYQADSRSLRYHVVFPYGNGVYCGRPYFVTEHAIQSPTEIGITRGSDGRNQRQGEPCP